MKFFRILIISLISFFLIIFIDFFFGKYILNYIFAYNKPIIENSVYHHDLKKILTRNMSITKYITILYAPMNTVLKVIVKKKKFLRK